MAKLTSIKSDANSIKILTAVRDNPCSTTKFIIQVSMLSKGWGCAFERMRKSGWLERHEGRPATWSITELGKKIIETAQANGNKYFTFGEFSLPVLAGHEKSKEAAVAFLKMLKELSEDEAGFKLENSPTWNSLPEEVKELFDGYSRFIDAERRDLALAEKGFRLWHGSLESYTWFYHDFGYCDKFSLSGDNHRLNERGHKLLKQFEIAQALVA